MGKKYKAVAITVPNKNTSDEFVASVNETRYVIKDMESGSIVDDAQGYGYRTAQKAYAGWSYKMSSSRPFSGGITAEGGEKSPSTVKYSLSPLSSYRRGAAYKYSPATCRSGWQYSCA